MHAIQSITTSFVVNVGVDLLRHRDSTVPPDDHGITGGDAERLQQGSGVVAQIVDSNQSKIVCMPGFRYSRTIVSYSAYVARRLDGLATFSSQ